MESSTQFIDNTHKELEFDDSIRSHYLARGHVTLDDVLSQTEIDVLKDRIDGMLEGRYTDFDRSKFVVGMASNQGPEDPGRLIQQVMPIEMPVPDDCLRAFGDHPRIKSIVKFLLDCPHVELFQQQALIKGPGQPNATPWHQDNFYWRSSLPAVTAWFPLEPVGKENGTMSIVLDSHESDFVEHQNAAGISQFQEAQVDPDPSKILALELDPGSISFHHKMTLHGASPNLGKVRRIAVAQHYMGLTDEEHEEFLKDRQAFMESRKIEN